MKKSYKIEVDCANCANKMEDAARRTPGVKDATVNFMTLKMNVEFEEGQDPKAVMAAGSQKLQKGGKRLRDLPVSAFPRNARPSGSDCGICGIARVFLQR